MPGDGIRTNTLVKQQKRPDIHHISRPLACSLGAVLRATTFQLSSPYYNYLGFALN